MVVNAQTPYSWSTTSTTPIPIYYVQIIPAPPKSTPTSRWLDRCKKNAEEWLKKQLAEIEERAEKNAWRVNVSNHSPEKPWHALSYWSLGRATSDDTSYHDTSRTQGPTWKTYEKRYDAGWLGLTISDFSEFELSKMMEFLGTIRKKDYLYHAGDDYECDAKTNGDDNENNVKKIGGYVDYCLSFWFSNQEIHDRFVALLESFPKRNKFVVVDSVGDVDTSPFAMDKNIKIIKGEHACGISFPEDVDELYIKLFIG